MKKVKLIEVSARMIADYFLVHLCMIAACAGSVAYQLHAGSGAEAQQLATGLVAYYVVPFTALSFIFPLVFWSHGFYTRSRAYPERHKRVVVAQGSVTAVFLFLAANYILFTTIVPARSVAVLFGALVPLATIAAREIKNFFVRHAAPVAGSQVEVSETATNRILVVGGAGYIGSVLVHDLLNAGCHVDVLDRLMYGYQSIDSVLDHPRFTLQVGDCRNIQDVVKAVRGAASIVHLAAVVGDPACDYDRRTALETNYSATRMLIEIAKGNGVQRLVFASSCSVYGASEFLCDENTEPRPISLYAETKINSEQIIQAARSEVFHPTILRFATVFGDSPRPRFDLAVNLLTAKAKQEQVITIYNGQQWRPFLHVRDVSRAIVAVLRAPVELVSGEVFNVGDSNLNYTLEQVARCISGEFPGTRVEYVDNSDARNYRVSFHKVKRRLGFQSTITLEEGIRQMKSALDHNPAIDYKDSVYSNIRYLEAMGSPEYKDAIDGRLMAAFAASSEAAVEGRLMAAFAASSEAAVEGRLMAVLSATPETAKSHLAARA